MKKCDLEQGVVFIIYLIGLSHSPYKNVYCRKCKGDKQKERRLK